LKRSAQTNTIVNNASAQPEGRFRIRYRYVGFGNPLRETAGARTESKDLASAEMLFENEVAVDVGNACWHQKGEKRRILDHHFELDDVMPSASAAVLFNVRALADWANALAAESPPDRELWLTTHQEPDFDAFCALNLARWILQGEITPKDFEGVLFAETSAEEATAVNWFAPQFPSTISAAGRSAMLLACYASSVDQGRPMRTPRSRRLHALLYAVLERSRPLGRPLLEEGALSFFNEVRRRLQAGDLNPLFDTIFEPSDTSCRYALELTLLAQEETAYQRDVQRARRAYVRVYRTDEPFEKWFERLAHIPFFARPGEVDPRHMTFPEQERMAVEGIFLRDPQSFLFKEWAREDTENSRSGQGFLFTAVAYSDGLTQAPAGKRTRYIFALDPERARGGHLYNLWARLQEAEFRRRKISECPREDHRRDFAGRRVGRDPWFDGNSYRGTIIDTPSSGTALSAGSTSDLSDISADTVESVLRQELEYTWYCERQMEIWDFPAGAETSDGSPVRHGVFEIDQPAKLPELVPEYLRFGRITLDPETDTRDRRLAMQIGRDLWQILEDQDTSTLPSDFETHHLVPGAHAIVVWSRRGAAIAHRGEKGKEEANKLVEAFSSVAEVRQGLGRMLKGNGGKSDELAWDMAAQGERLQEGARLTETIIPLQLLASSPEGAALRRFFASTPFDSVLQSLHELNQGNLGLLHQQAIEYAATSVNKNVQAITSMQTKVEYVEVFLVGMYSIYLIHYLGEAFHFGDVPYYVGSWIIAGIVIASTVAALLLQPWHQDKHSKTESPGPPQPPGKTKSPLRKMFWISALAIAMLALYVTGGFWFKNHPVGSHDQSQKQEQSEPAVPPSKPSP
jgi:hypothetical protein